MSEERRANQARSLVGFSQGLSASQYCFLLTINQHQPGLSAQKPTIEQVWLSEWRTTGTHRLLLGAMDASGKLPSSLACVGDRGIKESNPDLGARKQSSLGYV